MSVNLNVEQVVGHKVHAFSVQTKVSVICAAGFLIRYEIKGRDAHDAVLASEQQLTFSRVIHGNNSLSLVSLFPIDAWGSSFPCAWSSNCGPVSLSLMCTQNQYCVSWKQPALVGNVKL